MELIDPFQDNNTGAAWDSSDESGKSQVREYGYQGRYNSGEPELHFLMNARGITIVDDIRMVERIITFQPEETFLALGAQWKITPGTEEPPANWYQPDCDDSACTTATSPWGYGEDEAEDGGTTMAEMRGNHISVYMRTEFTIPDPMNIGTLRLYTAYDDGFIVYLNGSRIHIENMRTSGEDIQDSFDARARSSRERTSSGQADINMLDFMDLLIAGTTGSGKSVALNAMILSLLYRLSPNDCKFIMIDPKMLELSIYDDIPHLMSPVVTEPKQAVVALKWTVQEMETRYRAMSKLGVRNVEGYNKRVAEARKKGEVLTRKVQTGFDPDTGKPIIEEQPLDLSSLPLIVVVVDEMADLMMVAGKDIEGAIQRLAQIARAAGIHLIMATQRPSVDVVTGTIKTNFQTRIRFQVTSKVDSRTILGEQGAEQLLGQGDMLYMAGGGRVTRVHGPFVDDLEVESVVQFLKTQGEPSYVEAITDENGAASLDGFEGPEKTGDELYDRAVALVAHEGKASTSFIQRHLQIGYNRAARIIETMEKEGVVSQANHVGKREVLVGDHSSAA